MLVAFALFALQLPETVLSSPQAVEQNSAAAHQALALRLAELSYTREMLPVSQENYARDFAKNIVKTPQGARIEQRFPGFSLKFALAAQRIMRPKLYARLPDLHRQMADRYAAALTDEEMTQATAFLSSDAGKRFRSTTMARIDVGSLIADPSDAGRKNALDQAAKTTLADMSAADAAAFERWVSSPVGRKMLDVTVVSQPIVKAWSDGDPALRAEVEALPMKIIQQMANK